METPGAANDANSDSLLIATISTALRFSKDFRLLAFQGCDSHERVTYADGMASAVAKALREFKIIP
jgi:hypothetical protein